MRIIIKGADFSAVSIGKVVKDLSFEFKSGQGMDYVNAFFPNCNSGTPKDTTVYAGTSGASTITTDVNPNRLVTDYIEVSEGMTVDIRFWTSGGTGTPDIVAFDSNKEPVAAQCKWVDGRGDATLTVPATVKYIKLQSSSSSATISTLANISVGNVPHAVGSMPE